MATVVLKKEYRCFDDCKQEGCPSHTAVLEFQTASNMYTFDNGKGDVLCFEQGEIQILVDLLKELSASRVDSCRL